MKVNVTTVSPQKKERGGMRPLSFEETRVRKWILKNRGILTTIASKCGEVSPQFVQQVAYGRATARPGHPVERELLAAGWPAPKRARG